MGRQPNSGANPITHTWIIGTCTLTESLTTDPGVEVQETCELSLGRIEERKKLNGADNTTTSTFLSVDPALPARRGLSVDQLRYHFQL
jgi:hypothetical protein